MGRNNRSRKRRDEMNKIKKARYEAKELIRLKKTLGLLDADGNEIMKDISDVAEVKTAKEIKRVSFIQSYSVALMAIVITQFGYFYKVELGKTVFELYYTVLYMIIN